MGGFNVQIVGLTHEQAEQMGITKVIDYTLNKLNKIVDIQELRLHIKTSDVDGERQRFFLNCKLYTNIGEYVVEREGWAILDLLEELMDDLERLVLKGKSRYKTQKLKKLGR